MECFKVDEFNAVQIAYRFKKSIKRTETGTLSLKKWCNFEIIRVLWKVAKYGHTLNKERILRYSERSRI